MKIKEKRKIGHIEQKILLLLGAGIALLLTKNPNDHFRIIKSTIKVWDDINYRSLREAVRRLYQSQMVDFKENEDGTVTIVLADEKNKKRLLRYNPNGIVLSKPQRWDGFWRIVIFDIPEHLKKGRDALSSRLKYLGMKPLQKSVFIYPYNCKEEIEFLAEIFEVKPYVRFILEKEVDVALELKIKFKLE